MNADAAARHSSGLLAILSVAPPYLWKGASHPPLANRAYWTSQKSISSAHRPCERIEEAGWGVLVTREKKMQFPANRAGRPSRIEGGWCDRMLWAGNHAGHIHRRSQSGGPVFEPRTEAWMPLSGGIHFVD
jgi:hypothetical protein